jgi:hypothetical protein
MRVFLSSSQKSARKLEEPPVHYVFHLVFERPFIRRRDAMSSSIAGSGISERVTVA